MAVAGDKLLLAASHGVDHGALASRAKSRITVNQTADQPDIFTCSGLPPVWAY